MPLGLVLLLWARDFTSFAMLTSGYWNWFAVSSRFCCSWRSELSRLNQQRWLSLENRSGTLCLACIHLSAVCPIQRSQQGQYSQFSQCTWELMNLRAGRHRVISWCDLKAFRKEDSLISVRKFWLNLKLPKENSWKTGALSLNQSFQSTKQGSLDLMKENSKSQTWLLIYWCDSWSERAIILHSEHKRYAS